MAGIEISEELTNDQLEALAGGELVKQEVSADSDDIFHLNHIVQLDLHNMTTVVDPFIYICK